MAKSCLDGLDSVSSSAWFKIGASLRFEVAERWRQVAHTFQKDSAFVGATAQQGRHASFGCTGTSTAGPPNFRKRQEVQERVCDRLAPLAGTTGPACPSQTSPCARPAIGATSVKIVGRAQVLTPLKFDSTQADIFLVD